MSWEDDKDLGPWEFVEQPNKWGYLNNPRWMPTPSDPVSYDGNESNEPQIWTPNDYRRSANGSGEHFPCGHWHKLPLYPPTTPPPTLTYLSWFCCPQTVVYGNNTTDIFYLTTDHDDPISTLYIIKYNRTTGLWEIVYTTTALNDSGLGYDFRWTEPPIAKASYNNLVVFGLVRVINDAGTYRYGSDIFSFNGESLVSNTQLGLVVGGRTSIMPFYYSRWIAIESNNYIHVVKSEYSGGNSYYYDFISTDNGISFNPVFIHSRSSYFYSHFITIDSSGNLWTWLHSRIHKSTDHGSSWVFISNGPSISNIYDFAYLNDALFLVDSLQRIHRSTNGVVWNIVNNPGISYPRGSVLGYDGTYYYCISCFRDGVGNTTGYHNVYRSSDGITWALLTSFTDDAEVGSSGTVGSADLSFKDGKIVYTFYYGSTLLAPYPDVYLMSVWESSDAGANWTPIQTPFVDLTTGVWPY